MNIRIAIAAGCLLGAASPVVAAPITVEQVVECYIEQGDGSPGSARPQCSIELDKAGVKRVVGTGESGYFIVADGASEAAKFGFAGASLAKAKQDGCFKFKGRVKFTAEVKSIEPPSDGYYFGELSVVEVLSNAGLRLSTSGCD